MCAWDKSYRNSAYPKNIINPHEMNNRERLFYDALIEVLEDDIAVEDLVVEQRNGDYRTVVYGSWDNDFLRYHFDNTSFWVSVRMPRSLMKEYADSPLFSAQTNKRQFHWRASIEPEEIAALKDIMACSAKYFLAALQDERPSEQPAASRPRKSNRTEQVACSSEIATLVRSLWSDSSGDVKRFKKNASDSDLSLISPRELSVALANQHPAASKLAAGDPLTCVGEPENPYDQNAIALYNENMERVGYLPKGIVQTKTSEAMGRCEKPVAVVTHNGVKPGAKRSRVHILVFS